METIPGFHRFAAAIRCANLFPTNWWQSRFKSQALLDETALVTCLAYVDLNPIRAQMAATPETSEFTTAKERITTAQEAPESSEPHQPKALFPFVGYPRQEMPVGLPFRLQDYLELVDWTGRQLRNDKRGNIDDSTPPTLERLNIDAEHWIYNTQHFESQFKGLVGTAISIKAKFQQFGYQRTPGLGLAELLTWLFNLKKIRFTGKPESLLCVEAGNLAGFRVDEMLSLNSFAKYQITFKNEAVQVPFFKCACPISPFRPISLLV